VEENMTLGELLATLAGNEALCITVIETVEEVDNVIIRFEASGYEALDSTLLDRVVSEVTIIAASGILSGEKKITVKVIR